MNDHPASTDDELVSAYLDGEATAEERARVENDPVLQIRLREFRDVAHQVATPSFFDSPDRDRLIAEALRVGNQAKPDTNVVSMASRRNGPLAGRFLPVLAAAAAVCFVALGALGGFGPSDSSDNDTTLAVGSTETSLDADGLLPIDDEMSASAETGAESVEDSGIDSIEADAAGPEEVMSDGSPSPTSEEGPAYDDTDVANRSDPPTDLGSFDEPTAAASAIDDLLEPLLADAQAAEIETAVGGDGFVTDFGDPIIDTCLADVILADPEVSYLRLAAQYNLAGEVHLVLLFALDQSLGVNGEFRLYDLVPGTCDQLTPGETLS